MEFDYQIRFGMDKGQVCKILRPAKDPKNVFVETKDGTRILLKRCEIQRDEKHAS